MLPHLYLAGANSGWVRGMVAVTRALVAKAGLPKGARVLEVGCGSGVLLDALHHDRPDLALAGLDLNPLALSAAKHAERLIQASLLQLPFGESSFDVILALDALDQEGVDLDAALAGMRWLLAPGGFVIVRVSAYPWLYGTHDLAFNTARRYTTLALVRAVERAGLRPERVTHANFLLAGPVVALRLFERLRGTPAAFGVYDAGFINFVVDAALMLESLWLRWLALPLGLSLIVVARRDPTAASL